MRKGGKYVCEHQGERREGGREGGREKAHTHTYTTRGGREGGREGGRTVDGSIVAVGDGIHGVPARVEGKSINLSTRDQVGNAALLRHFLGVACPALVFVEDSGRIGVLRGGREGGRGGREGGKGG